MPCSLLYYNYKTTKKFTPSDYKFIKVGGVQAHVFVFNNSELKYVVENFQNLPFFYQISDAHKCPLRTLLSKPFLTRNFKPMKCVKSSCIHVQNDLSERGVQLNKMPLKYLQQMMSNVLYRFHAAGTKDYYTYCARMFLSQIEQQK